MRVRVRENPYDLYAVMASSVLLLLVLLIVPGAGVLRILLGLPFILFFPGYALVSALYPEKPTVEGAPGAAAEMTKGADPRTSRAYARKARRHAMGPEEAAPGEGEAQMNGRKVKGLEPLERIALSMGLSIAISPLIGLLLNYTYDWDPENLGIRLTTVFGALFVFIMITSAVAVRRRARVPVEDRFGIDLEIAMPADRSMADKALTVGIVVMMVLSISLLVYMIAVPRGGERFTEFYVLGRSGKADDYPGNFLTGSLQHVTLGIGNHERGDENYTLVIMLDGGGANRTYTDLDRVEVSRSSNPTLEVMVPRGRTVEIPVNFSVPDPGAFKLRFLLFLDGKEHRDLHVWVRCFPPGLMVGMTSGIQFYATGAGGDPALAGRTEGGRTSLGIGLVNDGEGPLACNITVHTGSPATFLAAVPGNGTWTITEVQGLYCRVSADAGRTTFIELEIAVPASEGGLILDLKCSGLPGGRIVIPLSGASA